MLWCVFGTLATLYLARRVRLLRPPTLIAALAVAIYSFFLDDRKYPHLWPNHAAATFREWSGSLVHLWWLWTICTSLLLFVFGRNRKPQSSEGASPDPKKRQFLRASTVALCAAVPAAVLGAGVITRKNFVINEVEIKFPNLPKDLHGLRMLQISDIHMGPFFSANDLRRVVDASNELHPDIAFVTGDLITTHEDPLDLCISELTRLRSGSGIWGCLGNHEFYAKLESYTKRKAADYGIEFLREEARLLRFGNSRLNLVGVDYRPWQKLVEAEGLIEPGEFNLLLAHTPEVFPYAAKKGFDLTLSGHTHGGQINLDVLGTNFNVADLHTPYSKGLYRLPGSVIYVNSGLGTIGLPVRIGAPPEITLVRLCKS